MSHRLFGQFVPWKSFVRCLGDCTFYHQKYRPILFELFAKLRLEATDSEYLEFQYMLSFFSLKRCKESALVLCAHARTKVLHVIFEQCWGHCHCILVNDYKGEKHCSNAESVSFVRCADLWSTSASCLTVRGQLFAWWTHQVGVVRPRWSAKTIDRERCKLGRLEYSSQRASTLNKTLKCMYQLSKSFQHPGVLMSSPFHIFICKYANEEFRASQTPM